MDRVASLGSINVDRVAYLDADALATLRDAAWFPAPGETRRLETVPAAAREHVTETFLGGKGANQAVAAALAGGHVPDERTDSHDGVTTVSTVPADRTVEAALYGRYGHDAAEYGVVDGLRNRGVDLAAASAASVPTGAAYVFVAPDGENHIVVIGGANDAVDTEYVTEHATALRALDVLCVQNELPVGTTAHALEMLAADQPRVDADGRRSVAAGPITVCNPAPVADADRLLAHSPDVVVVNDGEYRALRDRLATCPVVIHTRGADPVVVEAPDETFEIAPPPVDPVDTTGAGDVFVGYLSVALARGHDLRAAVETATVAAALSTEREGVQRATPTAGTIAEFRPDDRSLVDQD